MRSPDGHNEPHGSTADLAQWIAGGRTTTAGAPRRCAPSWPACWGHGRGDRDDRAGRPAAATARCSSWCSVCWRWPARCRWRTAHGRRRDRRIGSEPVVGHAVSDTDHRRSSALSWWLVTGSAAPVHGPRPSSCRCRFCCWPWPVRSVPVIGSCLGLAALIPTFALAGAAVRRREEAREYTSAREDIVGTLLEHTARGERARIARELHDVVAHHVSMIAVQAETARLTTPDMPAAGRAAALRDRRHRAGGADRDAPAARRVARGRRRADRRPPAATRSGPAQRPARRGKRRRPARPPG